MSVRKRGLGRGLDALLGSAATGGASADDLRELPLEALQAGRHQPRRDFNAEALQELAASVAAQGVVQPIVVRPVGDERYEIVAGERRWRAAKLAGLTVIPAVVRTLDDRAAMAVALVENIQRADLNPIEEAEALQRLIDECGWTHDQTAQAVGRSRVTITNLLRVLDLDPRLRQWLREGRLTLGHAKVLLGAAPEHQQALAQTVIDGHLSVRETEALLARRERSPQAPAAASDPHPAEARIGRKLGLPVQVRQSERGNGRLTIRFRNATELQRLLEVLG